MLSRVAEGMFWRDRYMERTDGMLLTLNTAKQICFHLNRFKMDIIRS